MKKILLSIFALSVLVPTFVFASFDSSLKYGSRGDAVIELQDFLQDQGFLKGNADGRFGLGTRKAVIAFQKANELKGDGYFGKASRVKASSILATELKPSEDAEQAEIGTVTPAPTATSPTSTNTATVAGCTSSAGFSPTTGAPCNSTNAHISGTSKFDNSVLNAVVQIQIWDTSANKYISWGTGISMGSEFLTNYHVAKLVITNPSRYTAFACVTNSINTKPDCKLQLSLTRHLWDKSVSTPKYDQNADLALFYLNKVNSNGTWKSWMDTSLNDWGIGSIKLNEYIKNYQDIVFGDHVYSIGYPDYGGGKTIQVDGTIIKKIIDPQSKLPLAVSDFKISFGNSGGPVFNSDGKLIGVTVQCFVDSNNKCIAGIFIPLPTLNWWYTGATDSHIFTFDGSSMYMPNSGSSDEVMKTALCMYPLRQNAHFDQTKNGCSCNVGFSENSSGECVDGTGFVDPKLRYGQPIDKEGEKKALQTLDSLFGALKNSPQTPQQNKITIPAPTPVKPITPSPIKDITPPTIIEIKNTDTTTTETVLKWSTDEVATGLITVKIGPFGVDSIGRDIVAVPNGKLFSVPIDKLIPATEYYVRIKVTDTAGNISIAYYNFKTLPPAVSIPQFLLKWGSLGQSDDGTFTFPEDVAVDTSGNVYVTGRDDHRVQKFTNNGTFVAKWGGNGTGDGQFQSPEGIAVDGAGNVYVGDRSNARIQKFTSSGVFVTKWGSYGTRDGQFKDPWRVAVDSSGNVYVADATNYRVQKFTSDGTFITKWGSQGTANGQFDLPRGIAVDSSGNVYIADRNNNRIQKFDANGVFLSTFGNFGTGNGQFNHPAGIALDTSGNLYVVDADNNRIQMFDSKGIFVLKWGVNSSADGQFNTPRGIAIDLNNNVFIADTDSHRIQKFK